MDLFTQLITTAAASKGIDIAYNEIKKLINKSKDIAVQKALSEQRDLIRILYDKINKVDNEFKELIGKNLQEPDTTFIFNKALTGSYLYSDPLKTEVLAEMIWARLISKDSNNVLNQIINDCISKMEKLSKNQLNILAMAYILEMSNEFSTKKVFTINYLDEWIEGKRDNKYFFERNCIDIPIIAEKFSALDQIQINNEDIFLLKVIGLTEIESVETTYIFRNRYFNTLNKYPELAKSNFLEYYNDSLIREITDMYKFGFNDIFYKMNLNFSGLYLGEQVAKTFKEKSDDIKNSREAKAKYNQAQYEKYRAGDLGEGTKTKP